VTDVTPGAQDPTGSTILVAGAAGLLGSAVTRRLAGAGETVVAADFLGGPGDGRAVREARAGALGKLRNATVARIDLSSSMRTEPFLRRLRPSAVVNAALFDPRGPGLAPLLEACRSSGVGFFLHLSDAALYPDAPEAGAPAHEDEPRSAGDDPYLAQRLHEESLLEASGLPYAILRVFSLYGPELPERRRSAQETETILRGRPAPFADDRPRDFLHVDDAARGIHAALRERPSGEILNLGSGVAVAPSQVLLTLCLRAGIAFSFGAAGAPSPRCPRVADTAKATSLLAFSPERKLADGVSPLLPARRPPAALAAREAAPAAPSVVSRRELFDLFRRRTTSGKG
jgi:nucleoside-diphosphate-sugar epimerase